MIANRLSDNVFLLRTKKKWTRTQLADMADISPSYLEYIENKKSKNPSVFIANALAEAFDVSVDFLVNNMDRRHNGGVEDELFIEKYKNLDNLTKKNIRDIADILIKNSQV